ncbi:hypothetical protein MO973_13360 [Paenibacillus sp. TRM 82003]|nr:hypothetical protein [Paenibacillus sp. TRM 82003]
MSAPIDFAVHLCLIREAAGEGASSFEDDVEEELEALFSGLGYWYTEGKTENEAEVLVAEVKGRDGFADEESALRYLEERGSERFWSWLQGYRIQVEPIGAGCAHCRA